MIMSGQFHIDPESLNRRVKCGQSVKWSVNNPTHKILFFTEFTLTMTTLVMIAS